MPDFQILAKHKPIKTYYLSLQQYSLLRATHEGAVSSAFGVLLQQCGLQMKWTLIGQYAINRPKKHPLRVDGALVDQWSIVRGMWEAKDEHDDLALEAKKKIELGYPADNILFQTPQRAILYQNGKLVLDDPIVEPKSLVEVLRAFFRYQPPQIDQWERAVDEFKLKVPELGQALLTIVDTERKDNPFFAKSFNHFVEVCRRSLNPSLSETAVEKMLAQHILTERIFRKVFDNPDFVRRNAVASEVEKVIDSLTRRHFNRDKFLGGLDRFYGAIERTAASIDEFEEKQHFLNTVYEKFFQGFDEKTADTHGVVYTPQSIVQFIVRSVDKTLTREFDRSLGDKGVHILDPFVGTGNFVLHVMRHMPKSRLPAKYDGELHANEVMLLPYYIASMNIEHEYAELTGEYRPFDGLCLTDTFELAQPAQQNLHMMAEKNAERVERQRKSPINVIIGNPPYNAGQVNENDNNRNRKYAVVDGRVGETYASDSAATLVNSLSDPYVKAFRWASDRLGDEGVLAYVSNNSYLAQFAFDGMRKHLVQDFDTLYILDLGGNVRKNPKLSGTTHNVFGIQVGVAIGIFIRHKRNKSITGSRKGRIFYAATGDDWRREMKYKYLDDAVDINGIAWKEIEPDARHTWLTDGLRHEFAEWMPVIASAPNGQEPLSLFRTCTMGVKSNNDAYVYDFDLNKLSDRAQKMVDAYNCELQRWKSTKSPNIETFLKVDEKILKWIRKTKRHLVRGDAASFVASNIVEASYRPFVGQWYFIDRMFSEDVYGMPRAFPSGLVENRVIGVTGAASEKPFTAWASARIVDQAFLGGGTGAQCFPFFTYSGGERHENITNWALEKFQGHYGDALITKWDIFHYTYALLQHPSYRAEYGADLKRDLPRIPFAPDFLAFVAAGKRLVDIHVDYENQREWKLRRLETPGQALNLGVERMRLSKDRSQIVYNSFLTLQGVPAEAFGFRLGNRSAIEWLIDQYQISVDSRSGISSDPNRRDNPEYIIELIGKVITISVETVRIVSALPPILSADRAHRSIDKVTSPPVSKDPDAV